jgi:uncharacterized DUF497 family protein
LRQSLAGDRGEAKAPVPEKARSQTAVLDLTTDVPYISLVDEFEWDEAKAESNLAKHRFSFEDAWEVFADPNVVIVPTFREGDGEDRFKAIGQISGRVFSVVYAERGDAKRLISARRANAKEERLYGDHSQ